MIKISDSTISFDDVINKYEPNEYSEKIIKKLTESSKEYAYESFESLKFELDLRTSIIETSIELYKSDLKFRTFRKSICNEEFWTRTDEGGFLQKESVSSSDAINDIFINSSLYGTECATAMVIIYYKAVLNIFSEKLFNELFQNIHLMGWYYVDDDLNIRVYVKQEEYLPGDCRYFKNPDVDPEKPEWQGENVIDLNGELYYGHGLGVANEEKIISMLNKKRKEDADEEAYLTDLVNHPNFKALERKYYSNSSLS